MAKYIQNGSVISVMEDADLLINNALPVGVYNILIMPQQPIRLQRLADLQLPEKIYGDDMHQKVNKVVNTFKTRSKSTGILLTGTKGAGKTLMSRMIAQATGLPVILVTFQQIHSSVVNFLESIDTECVIIFDEFDKVNDDDCDTDVLLGLLDGTSTQKKLYIFTANEAYHLNGLMFNRPGRIFYHLEFGSVDLEAIIEYCQEKGLSKAWCDEMKQIAYGSHMFSFDILQAITEECLRYNVSPMEACKDMNVSVQTSGNYHVSVAYAEEHKKQNQDIIMIEPRPYNTVCCHFDRAAPSMAHVAWTTRQEVEQTLKKAQKDKDGEQVTACKLALQYGYFIQQIDPAAINIRRQVFDAKQYDDVDGTDLIYRIEDIVITLRKSSAYYNGGYQYEDYDAFA